MDIQDNQIVFTDKEKTRVYKTGLLLTWVLPGLFFVAFRQFLSKKMMDKAGGPSAMSFNMGKSNAKAYQFITIVSK